MKKKNQLPNKPSELILLALGDLKKVERSKKYEVNMSQWHKPNGACKVCLAGSVIAMTLGADPTDNYLDGDLGFNRDTVKKIYALNGFRSGDIDYGLNEINKSVKKGIPKKMEVIPYEKNATQFKNDMRKMAKLLKSKGL